MTDRAFEPADPDPFDQIEARPGAVEGADDPNDPFAEIEKKPGALAQQPEVTSFGAFRRSAVRSAVPALGGLAAAGPLAELGGAAGLAVGGPVGGIVGGVAGGLAGAIGGSYALDTAQHWALKALPESWTDALGMSDRQEKLDREGAPVSSFMGGLAPYVFTMRPGGFGRPTLPDNATALQRLMANPATARLFGGGVMGGMELGQEAVEGEPLDWQRVGISTGFGIVFNKPTRIGEGITELGARPVRRALGVPEPHAAPPANQPATEQPAEAEAAPAPTEDRRATPVDGIAPTLFHAPAGPTVAEAADLNVMGPGVTEQVFQGSHEKDPVTAQATQDNRRTEQSVIGPSPEPDVHSIARQMDFDLFNEYDRLKERRRALEPGPHLAATEDEIAALEPQVQAAYRRAAEATGRPAAEAPAELPTNSDIERQKATIADDVTTQLMAAGRPQEEAGAAGKLVAARYVARASRMGGALGTPEELYRREGAEIRRAQIGAKIRTPAQARALENFQARMAEGKAEAQQRRNEGLSTGGKAITTAERYRGMTEEEFKAEQTAKEDALEGLEPEERGPVREAIDLMKEDDHDTALGEFYQISAYHGSPHLFDKFDTSKIGTGEGAQAYGHGLYFAENEGIARSYRNDLGAAHTSFSHPEAGENLGFHQTDDVIAAAVRKVAPDLPQRKIDTIATNTTEALKNGDDIEHMRSFVQKSDWDRKEKDAWMAALDEGQRFTLKKPEGALYKVSLKPDKEDLLDWDKPLSEQSEKIKAALRSLPEIKAEPELLTDPGFSGSHLVQIVGGTSPEFSKKLSEAGIPGIKYGDAGSRGAAGGTHNFVIFDHNDVEITHRNGEALTKEERQNAVRELEQRDIFADAAARLARRKEEAAEIAKAGVSVKMTHGDGRTALVGPDMSKPGTWRVTRFDKDGPLGHTEYPDAEAAALDALKQGFKTPNSELHQTALGKINLNPKGLPGKDYTGAEGVRPVLTLMKNANASTAVHELGHEWLAQMLRDAEHEKAPEAIKADRDTVLKWFGIDKTADIQTKHHEKFARGFEQYLREGIAPSQELAGVFARFKQWLTQIYQTLKGLGQPINDDIRKVFDRLLTAPDRGAVIAPERTERPTLADIHEADAREIEPKHADAGADRIAAEADQHYVENPHVPEFETALEEQLAAEAAAGAVEPGGEARPGGVEGGEVQPANPEPESRGGGVEAQYAAERPGGAEPAQEGAGSREGERNTERERSDAVPLAGRPARDFTLAGQSFNVGKDGNVRAENITSAPQFIEAINESAQRIPGGGALTTGEMQGLADDLNLDPKTLDETRLAGLFGGIQNLSSKIYALRQAIKGQSETVFNAMRNVRETGSDQATAEFAVEAGRLDMMMSVLSSVTTEVGRGLGMSFKNLEGWQKAQDLNEFLKANTGKTLFQLKQVAKLGSQLDSPAKVAKYLRDAQKRSFAGMVLEYWINGLISGPATHATYAVGNTILSVEKMGPETAAAAMIGAARKAMGRQGETVRLGEVGAHFAGAVRSLAAGVQAGIEGFRTGMTTLLPGEAARPLIPFAGDTSLVTARTIGNEPVSWGEVGGDLFGLIRGMRDGIVSSAALIKAGGEAGAPLIGAHFTPYGQIPDIAFRGVPVLPVGSAIRLPGRFIAAIHSFFRTTNFGVYKAGGAYRAATSEGLTGHAFDARVADINQNPSEAMMEAWRTEATETALMGHVGKFGEALTKLTNTEFNLPVVGGVKLLKFIDPFVHISSNVLKQTVMLRTPAGLLSSEIRADLAGTNGTIAQDTAMARMLVGSALSITFGGLAAEGYMTGSGPSDPNEARMWREVYQPHSVRVGDLWYQVNRLGPMGMLAGIAADLYEVAHDAEEGDALKAAAHLQHAFTQNVLDESFMRGPADLIKAVEDPGRYGEGYIKNFLSSFVPFSVGMAQMARAEDPYARNARDVVDSIRAKVPGYSQELLPRRNIWGDEMPNLPALGGRAVSAIYEQRVNSDPVNRAMLDLGIHPAMPERTIRNVPLTDPQYDDFSRIAGRMAKQRLDMIVRSPDWQIMPNATRHDVVAEVLRQSRESARGIMMMKFPSIPRAAADNRKAVHTGTVPYGTKPAQAQ